jgi:cytochrome c2
MSVWCSLRTARRGYFFPYHVFLSVAVWAAAAFFVAGFSSVASAQKSGPDILDNQCAQCHALFSKGQQAQAIRAVRMRKGPPLFYAGNKYRKDWIIKWLQNPTRIRPGGMFFVNYVETSPRGDAISESRLPASHPKLTLDDAVAVAEALMALRAKSELIEKGAYVAQSVPKILGEMSFVKLLGCSSCHRNAPDSGGLSGPELYTSFERLQGDFLVSFIRDPIAWQPKIAMPQRPINAAAAGKLVNYLKLLSEEKK